MRWDIHEAVADGDLVAVHTTGHARHTGPFVIYDQSGAVRQVFPPTGKATSATQTHWFRLAGEQMLVIIEIKGPTGTRSPRPG